MSLGDDGSVEDWTVRGGDSKRGRDMAVVGAERGRALRPCDGPAMLAGDLYDHQ